MKQDGNGNYFEMWLREYRTRLQGVAEYGCNLAEANRNGNSERAETKLNVEKKEDSASPSASADDLFLHLRAVSESFGHQLKHA